MRRSGRALRVLLGQPIDTPATSAKPTPAAQTRRGYEHLYESHAQTTGDDGVGGGEYDVMGEIELDVLRAHGLDETSTLLDFGCGNGRLAVHAVAYLHCGTYVGIDIAPTFLEQARRRLRGLDPPSTCDVRLLHQVDERFDLADRSVDVGCAFSVFTHMEHEDMLRYLVQLRRVIRPGGTMVVSCLPMDLADARGIFLAEASFDPAARWQRVRNVTTSVDLVDVIAELAGWTVVTWLPGDQPQAVSESGEQRRLGQSIVVLTHDG